VWAAIFGCKGEQTGTLALHDRTLRAVGTFEYAWPHLPSRYGTAADSLRGADHQQFLNDAQADAGVEDYRTASVKRVNGVPTLVSR